MNDDDYKLVEITQIQYKLSKCCLHGVTACFSCISLKYSVVPENIGIDMECS